jgi:hypothetical protein
MLDSLNGGTPSSIIGYASLHSAFSLTGANELTGGGYGRQAVTWSLAAGGSKASASLAGAFSVPASSTVAFTGLWSALTAGIFTTMSPNDGGTLYAFTAASAAPGVLTAPGSSYASGQSVIVLPGAGATLPAGLSEGTIYYVVYVSADTFSLSATSGGSAITTTAAGAGIVQSVTLETFGAAGTFDVTEETLALF